MSTPGEWIYPTTGGESGKRAPDGHMKTTRARNDGQKSKSLWARIAARYHAWLEDGSANERRGTYIPGSSPPHGSGNKDGTGEAPQKGKRSASIWRNPISFILDAFGDGPPQERNDTWT